jgi:LmbE family N-acetylglucosaminyl deacetylase
MENEVKTILAIFAHPDDEIGAIGTLKNHSERGDRCVLAWLTHGEQATTLDGTLEEKRAIRQKHAEKVGELLDCEIRFVGFPDSRVEPSREASEEVAELIRDIKPDVIITWSVLWSTGGGHPDHRYTHQIVMDAITYARFPSEKTDLLPWRKRINIYSYRTTNSAKVRHIDISSRRELINEFVAIYEGMYGSWPALDYKLINAAYCGLQAQCELAECFEIIQEPPRTTKYFD